MKKIAILVIILAAAFGTFYLWNNHNQTEFNSQKWKELSSYKNDKLTRVDMVDDLLEKHQLKGKKKNQVIDLLGTVTKTDKFQDWDMVYWLGPERGFMSIDSEWLVLKLNKENEVIDVQVVRD